jgi:hypothetical protein
LLLTAGAWVPGLERQIVDALTKVSSLSLHLVLGFVDPPAQLSNLFLKRVHPGEQLRQQVTAASGWRRVSAATQIGRAPAPSCLVL